MFSWSSFSDEEFVEQSISEEINEDRLLGSVPLSDELSVDDDDVRFSDSLSGRSSEASSSRSSEASSSFESFGSIPLDT